MIDFEEDINKATAIIKQGGIILYPTDTIWGLGCDATNAAAVSKIFTLKKRVDSKALIVLVASEAEVLQYTTAVDFRLFDYLHTTQQPTTVIYEQGMGFATNLMAEDGSIAIRICRDAFCNTLIKNLGKPIVSTSANISGAAAPTNFKNISTLIKSGVDYVVQHRQTEETSTTVSAIIKWKDGSIERLR